MKSDSESLANSLKLSTVRHKCSRVLDTELPLFIELLSVAAENQVSIKDALRTVSYNSEDVCPFLSSEFRCIIANLAVTQKSLAEVLPAFAQKYDLYRLTELTEDIIEVEISESTTACLVLNQRAAISDFENFRKHKLQRSLDRRVILFFVFFALPMIVIPMLFAVTSYSSRYIIRDLDFPTTRYSR